MLRRTMLLMGCAGWAILAIPAMVHAYGCYHAGYTHVGYGGVQHVGTTGVHYGGTTAVHYGGYGGVYRAPAVVPYQGYSYGAYHYGGYSAGYVRRW